MAGNLVKKFDCPSCGSAITLRANGFSLAVNCEHCGSVLDLADENYRVISEYKKKARFQPLIPFGTRGKIGGGEFEMVGFVMRRDVASSYIWEEYLLFNPYRGYRWLTQAQGHWNFVTMTKERPQENTYFASKREFRGKSFNLFQKGFAEVAYVLGEFYWKVEVGEKVWAEDFVRPPQMLSVEKSDGEQAWSVAEYLPREQVREIFKIRVPMPTPQGVAPNQTDPLTRNSRTIYATFALIALLLVGVQRVTNGNRVGRVVHEGNYHFTSSDPDPKQNSPHFDLDGGLDNVEVSATSNIRNSWVEIKVGLIEANAPDKAYHYEKEISYYQGNDSDGFWSEGSPTDQTLLSSIPGGTYFVNLETGGPHDVTPWTRDVSLKILRGVPVSSNFWLAFFAAAFLPILVLIREAWFEGRRWADSNVSGS